MSQSYDFACSVGPNCRSSWNTQDYFGDFTTRPFDAWITPFWSTVELLKLRAVPILEADDFVHVKLAPHGHTIFNRRLNVFFHHAFDNGPDGDIAPNWRDQIPSVCQKYRHLFERFWTDFEAAQRPLLVLGGQLTFKDNPDLAAAGEVVPSFDTGTPSHADAAAIVRRLFPDKSVAVLNLLVGSITQAYEDRNAMFYVGQDDGTRPAYLPADAYQHPTNVFRDGFRHFGMILDQEAALIGQSQPGTILDVEAIRMERAASLLEKAEQLLLQEAQRERGKKYLRAAYQLHPATELTSSIEAVAVRHRVDLMADTNDVAPVDLAAID